MAQWKPGTHGGTYGGNVVSCAAANATLDVIQDEGLVANAADAGQQFLTGLRTLKAKYRSIGDAAGLGLMVALEFVQARRGRRPAARPGPDEARPGGGTGAQPHRSPFSFFLPPCSRRATYVNVGPDHPAPGHHIR
jgi:hypothetical protein